MNSIEYRLVLIGVLFILIALSGIWLSKLGRPLNNGVFTIHKLITVGTIILLVISTIKQHIFSQTVKIENIILLISGVALTISFITGALLSFGKLVNKFILTIHKISPIILIISFILYIYLNIKEIKNI
ncbi:hypothetical protein ACFLTE_03580 [Bacteroidota bacterium]